MKDTTTCFGPQAIFRLILELSQEKYRVQPLVLHIINSGGTRSHFTANVGVVSVWIQYETRAGRAGLWVGRAGPLPRPLTSRGRRKGSHRLATR
jgi:hypothetical protein